MNSMNRATTDGVGYCSRARYNHTKVYPCAIDFAAFATKDWTLSSGGRNWRCVGSVYYKCRTKSCPHRMMATKRPDGSCVVRTTDFGLSHCHRGMTDEMEELYQKTTNPDQSWPLEECDSPLARTAESDDPGLAVSAAVTEEHRRRSVYLVKSEMGVGEDVEPCSSRIAAGEDSSYSSRLMIDTKVGCEDEESEDIVDESGGREAQTNVFDGLIPMTVKIEEAKTKNLDVSQKEAPSDALSLVAQSAAIVNEGNGTVEGLPPDLKVDVPKETSEDLTAKSKSKKPSSSRELDTSEIPKSSSSAIGSSSAKNRSIDDDVLHLDKRNLKPSVECTDKPEMSQQTILCDTEEQPEEKAASFYCFEKPTSSKGTSNAPCEVKSTEKQEDLKQSGKNPDPEENAVVGGLPGTSQDEANNPSDGQVRMTIGDHLIVTRSAKRYSYVARRTSVECRNAAVSTPTSSQKTPSEPSEGEHPSPRGRKRIWAMCAGRLDSVALNAVRQPISGVDTTPIPAHRLQNDALAEKVFSTMNFRLQHDLLNLYTNDA